MGLNFFVIFLAILMQDALNISAERDFYPRYRKVALKDWRSSEGSLEGNPRVLYSYLLDKPTRRPTKANIIYINVPTGTTTSSGGTIDPPTSAPSSTTPSPRPHHTSEEFESEEDLSDSDYPIYPQILPYIHPIILPLPGWTGNPPPPFVPPRLQNNPPTAPPSPSPPIYPHYASPPIYPHYPYTPPSPPAPPIYPHKPEDLIRPRPPMPEWIDDPIGDLSESGTPTTTTQDGDDLWWLPKPIRGDNLKPNGLILVDTLSDTRRKPKPSKKPRPTKKPVAVTVKPETESQSLLVETATEVMTDAGNDLLGEKKKKPVPTVKPKPSNQPSQVTEGPLDLEPDEIEDDSLGNRKKKPRPSRKPRPSQKPVEVTENPDNQDLVVEDPNSENPEVTTVNSIMELEDDSLANQKKKPRPSRKPRPSKKPSQVPEKPDTDIVGNEESPIQAPANMGPLMLYGIPEEEGSGEVDDDLLVNRKKKPRPSKKPKPSKKPELIVGAQEGGEGPDEINRKKPSRKPELLTEEEDSSESLGPDRDLIVVQRKGKPMRIRLAQGNVIAPWKLFRFNTDWQRSLQRARGPNYFFLI